MKKVVIVGTMDTKGTEMRFAKSCIEQTGVDAVIMDMGVLIDSESDVEFSSRMVTKAAGCEIESIRFANEGEDSRDKALKVMTKGAKKLLAQLIEDDQCHAVMGMGGSGGTSMLADVFRSLPLGFPKILASTMMAGDLKDVVGTKDLTMMYSVTDIAGINTVSRKILGNAANAAAGMAKYQDNIKSNLVAKKPLIGLTMFGVTTKGVLNVREHLEKNGFDTIIFHCTGGGGRAMEEMIEQGLIEGVIDFTVAELNGHYITKMNDAGDARLTTASKKGIPQVVVPGAIEVSNYPGMANLPSHIDAQERHVIEHNSMVCAMKATNEEMLMLGKELANKLLLAEKNTVLILPEKGLDMYEITGGPWCDFEQDQKMFQVIRDVLKDQIPIETVDGNVNDAIFSTYVAERFMEIWNQYEN